VSSGAAVVVPKRVPQQRLLLLSALHNNQQSALLRAAGAWLRAREACSHSEKQTQQLRAQSDRQPRPW